MSALADTLSRRYPILSCTPTQAWQVKDRQSKVCHELPKLHLKIRVDVLKVDISSLNALSNEVIVHFDMLYACMEHQVPSQMNTIHVVAVKGSRILVGNAQILQNPLEQ